MQAKVVRDQFPGTRLAVNSDQVPVGRNQGGRGQPPATRGQKSNYKATIQPGGSLAAGELLGKGLGSGRIQA